MLMVETRPAEKGQSLPRRLCFPIAGALLAVMALLLTASVIQESPTFDEPVHLYSGFSYWKSADFGHNPEHPPLAKLLAAAPLLPLGLREPVLPFAVPYFKALDGVSAILLLYHGQADADSLILRGRLVIACFSLILGLLVFLAARFMFGDLAALLALTLFTLEPVLLANGAIITTDMPLACTFFATVYSFYHYVLRPSWQRTLLVALCSVLTLGTKHSGVLVLPTLLLLAAGDLVLRRPAAGSPGEPSKPSEPSQPRSEHRLRHYAIALGAILVLSYVGLWAIYGFRFAARPGQLQIIPSLEVYAAGLSPLQQAILGFSARHHLLPEAYLFGWVDILLIPAYRPSFLLGHLYGSGQWFYLPVLFLLKTSLTVLVLLALVPLARLGRQHRRELLFLALPPAVFLLLGALSRVNMGIRHLLPAYPFCIVLAGAAGAAFAMRSRVGRLAVAAGLVFAAISSLHAFPDYLAYANELAGGPAHLYRIAADSNDDWGQTLRWSQKYLDRTSAGQPCWIDYTNPMLPLDHYGIHCRPLLAGTGHLMGIPSGPLPSTVSGTFLISANDISGIFWGPGELNPYAPFRDSRPDDRIGNAVLVYRGTFAVPLLAAQSNAVLATAMLRAGKPEAALGFARAAAVQAPDSADIQAGLAQVLFASGQPGEGQQHLARAMQLAETVHPEYQRILLHELAQPLVPSPPPGGHKP